MQPLLEHIAALMDVGAWEGLSETVDRVANTRWDVEAYSMFDYDVDLEVEVEDVHLASDKAIENLLAIDYDGTLLSVSAQLVFTFSMEDVNLGALSDQRQMKAVLTFRNPECPQLDLVNIEILMPRTSLNFGDVAPDYSNENPHHEKY